MFLRIPIFVASTLAHANQSGNPNLGVPAGAIVGRDQPSGEVWTELLAWFLFSVVLGLAHFLVALIVTAVTSKRPRVSTLLKDGCLLFFAMPLAAGVFGECQMAHYWRANDGLNLSVAVGVLVLIFLVSVALYSLIVYQMGTASGKISKVSSSRISYGSVGVAIISVLYGVCLTLLRTAA